MNIKALKRTGLSIALAAAFLGVAGSSSAFAQDSQWRDRDGYGRIDGRRQQLEERKGFNDGLIAGRRDSQAHFRFNPSGSIRYQLGSADYRKGFQGGYAQAYRQYGDNYVYRNNDLYGPRDGYRNDQYRQGNDQYRQGNDQYRQGNDQYRQGGYYDRSGNFHSY
jgi:hypothetical protein